MAKVTLYNKSKRAFIIDKEGSSILPMSHSDIEESIAKTLCEKYPDELSLSKEISEARNAIDADREALEKERAEFEAERQAFAKKAKGETKKAE